MYSDFTFTWRCLVVWNVGVRPQRNTKRGKPIEARFGDRDLRVSRTPGLLNNVYGWKSPKRWPQVLKLGLRDKALSPRLVV